MKDDKRKICKELKIYLATFNSLNTAIISSQEPILNTGKGEFLVSKDWGIVSEAVRKKLCPDPNDIKKFYVSLKKPGKDIVKNNKFYIIDKGHIVNVVRDKTKRGDLIKLLLGKEQFFYLYER